MQDFRDRYQEARADDRTPEGADPAEHRHGQRLRRDQHAEHGLRGDHQNDDGIERTRHRRDRAADGDGPELPAQRVDPRSFGGRLVLLDRDQRHAEAGGFDLARQQHHDDQKRHRDQRVDPPVGELHVGCRIVMHARHADLGKAKPEEDVHEGQRIGEHAEREIVAAQAEGRKADGDAKHRADHARGEEHHPGRDRPVDLRQHRGEGARAEEGGMAEGYQPGIAAQNVPAQPEDRPDQDQRQHELVVGIGHERRERQVGERRNDEIEERFAACLHDHVRSTLRPNRPCGRSMTTSRKHTKMVAF